jgi:arylsulfatase A-like enzyme
MAPRRPEIAALLRTAFPVLALAGLAGVGLGCDGGTDHRAAATASVASPAVPATTAAATTTEGVDAVVFRFQDRLAEAEITGPDPERALLTVGARTRALVNPYGRAPGRRVYYLAELAFPGGRVADYAAGAKWPGDGPEHRGAQGAQGLMGGGSGVTAMRTGLLAPPDTSFTWKLRIPARAYLAFEVGVAPGRPGAPVSTTVSVDGQTVWSRATSFEDAGRWVPAEVDLARFAGRTVTLTLAAHAVRQASRQLAIGPALFADPMLLSRGTFAGPQIVVLSLDAVRADVVGANGSDFGITPNIDRLAAEGTSFSQAVIAWSWTRPSVIGALGGCYPGQLRASAGWEVDQETRELFYGGRPPLVTLDLRRAGYQIATIGTAVLFVGYHPLGLDLGWDHADDVRDLEEETAGTARGVIEFLRAHQRRPFFLYVHLDTAHYPYNPPPRLVEKVTQGPGAKRYRYGNARNYLAEVAFADEQVGRVRAALEHFGMAGRTLLVVTADHGENIDHDKYIVYPETQRNTLWGHGSTPYDNVLRVPLVFWQPGRIPPGRRIDTQVRTIDLAPTLDELAGLAPNPRHCSRSLGGLIRGETEAGPRVAVSYSFYSTIVRDGAWKLIQWHGDAAATRLLKGTTPVDTMEELYHVAVDPAEAQELSVAKPGQLRRMRRLLAEATRDARKPIPREGAAPVAAVPASFPAVIAAAAPTALAAPATPAAPAAAPSLAAPSAAPAAAPSVAPAAAPSLAAPSAAPAAAPSAVPPGAVGSPSAAASPSVAVLHLRLGTDEKPHRLEARLHSSKPLAVRATHGPVKVRATRGPVKVRATRGPVKVRATRGPVKVRATRGLAKVPDAVGTLIIEAAVGANAGAPEVAIEVDLDAAVDLEARLDGQEVHAGQFFAGPFSLALLEGTRAHIDRPAWAVLRAKRAPPPAGGGVYLWGEGGAGEAGGAGLAGPGASAADSADPAPVVTPVHAGDVANILKGWGYIHGNEKSTDKPK